MKFSRWGSNMEYHLYKNSIDFCTKKCRDLGHSFAAVENANFCSCYDEIAVRNAEKKNLEDFDKNNQTEKDLIFSNKEFELQQKALEQLRKDTGSNKAAGRGFGGGEDVIDYFKYIGRAFGVIDLRTEEASEVIKINKDVEKAIFQNLYNKCHFPESQDTGFITKKISIKDPVLPPKITFLAK